MNGLFTPQFGQLLLLVVLTVGFYFFAIRPQQKQRKERQALLKNVKQGDKVVTIGGICGTVIEIVGEDLVKIRVDENTVLKMTRNGIGQVQG